MGVSYKAFLVAGVSLLDFFGKVGEKTNTFKEFDKYGQPTGKNFTETKIIATLPSGDEVIIGDINEESPRRDINYDFYSSLSFDGDTSDQTTLGLHYHDYDTENLSCRIIGNVVDETENVEEIDYQRLDKTILEVRKELKEKFGYDGVVKLYLINYVSY